MTKISSEQGAPDDTLAERINLMAMLDSTEDLIWSVDRNFKLISSNQSFQDAVKVFSGETARKGSDVLSIYLQFITFYERAFSGERFTVIEYSRGSVERWFEISFFPIPKNKEVIGVACHSRDITSLKIEEHRMELLESVVTNTVDAVLITEAAPLEGEGPKIVYVNDALIKMTGYTREEMLGKSSRMLYGPNSDVTQIARAAACLAKSQPCEIEIINYKKNGEEFWMHTSIAVIADGNGASTHLISIGRDVTERVRNMQAIKEQNKILADIAWAQSHDVRGPLARIKGLVNLLSNHAHSEEDTELIGYLKIASNEMDDVVSKISKQAEEIYGFTR